MKKTIVLMAAIVAAGVTFTGCSNEEELTQVIEQPAVKGTPFSVNAFADGTTRATRYNADAWDGSNSTTWVSGFKLWGKQAGADAAWMNNIVFSRTAYNADWTPSEPNIAWPTDDEEMTTVDETTVATTFYAYTSGTANDATGVSQWMSVEGKFSFRFVTNEVAVPHTDPAVGTGVLLDGGQDTYVTDTTATSMADLMVATATKKESETTSGVLPLEFSHALSGLAIKLIFRNDGSYNGKKAWDEAEGTDEEKIQAGLTEYVDVKINYIKVYGLMTSATYTFGTGWSVPTTEGCYYKTFDTPLTISAQPESTAAASANSVMLVHPGEWLVIPQTTEPWDGGVMSTDAAEYIAAGKAYIVLGITDDQSNEDMEVFLPLNTTFTAGTNKTLRIDLGTFRDLYIADDIDDTKAAYYFAPAQGGGGAPAYIFEE